MRGTQGGDNEPSYDHSAAGRRRELLGSSPAGCACLADRRKRLCRDLERRNILGMVSDRDAAGLLLDLRGDETDALGYTFLPRFSVEQVDIPEVAHRQVEFPDS